MHVVVSVSAQTNNDHSEGIQQISLNVPTHSSTDNNTVERACIDEKLTGQCIQYHNDQWFYYTPATSKSFYINVRHGRCKDDRGVQLVVFKGELCKTDTYEVVSCSSPGVADDFYFKMENPEPAVNYFMIIDGYLEDFCDFTIEVSAKAFGVPVNLNEPIAEGILKLEKQTIELDWTYQPDGSDMRHFSVVRKKSGEDVKNWELPLTFNSRGTSSSSYVLKDTLLSAGSYTYDVYLVDGNNELTLFLQETVALVENLEKKEETTIFFPFATKRKTNLQVTILDASTKRVLFNRFIEEYSLEGFQYNFEELIERGHFFFEITIYDYKARRSQVFKQSFFR